MKLKDMKFPPVKALVYGPPGSGKTAFSTSFGEGAYVLDIGAGLLTAARYRDKFYEERQKIEIYQCLEPNPLQQAIAFKTLKAQFINIINQQNSASGWLNPTTGKPYELLIIDDLTFLFESVFRYILHQANKLGKEINPGKLQENNPSQPEWGLMINEVTQIISLIMTAKCNVVVNAHSTINDVNGIKTQEISVPTSVLPTKIANSFDELWFLEVQPSISGQGQRLLRTVSSYTYIARSRSCLADKTDVSLGIKQILTSIGQNFSN